MRLDKFLKNTRLIKRRTLAKKVADQGRIKVNNSVAKAATNVEVGDILEIQFGKALVTVEVLLVQEVVKKEDTDYLYKVIKEERVD